MDKFESRMIVFFKEPFWIGVFEKVEDGKLCTCKVTFGAQPKETEIYEFILKNYSTLKFSPAVLVEAKREITNPKRLQREAKKQTKNTGIGTKSQQALNLQREEMKTERKQINREQKEAEKARLFELKQQKRKEKHRGR